MPVAFSSPNFLSAVSLSERLNSRRQAESCCLPNSFDDIRLRAATSIKRALSAEIALIEVQFPSVPNLNTAALNQLLDANRQHARIILSRLKPEDYSGGLTALFPDNGEATLAAKAWRENLPCAIGSLSSHESSENSEGVVVCVNPGFNVSEWFSMQSLSSKFIVSLNGDLDRIRSGYYPRIFYPKLYKTRTEFLVNFQEVFYLKPLADGGMLFREYPKDWVLYYKPLSEQKSVVLWQGETRPEFKEVQSLLKNARIKDQLTR